MIPQTPAEVRRVLEERGLAPRKRFGQHFLADANLRDAVVREAGVRAGDLVVEIGPGLGVLTRGLLDAGAEVLAVEIDRGLCAFLREALAGEPRFHLTEGDVLLRGALRPDVVEAIGAAGEGRRCLLVSNLPYAVATPVFAGLARLPVPPESATGMVQREVALRMAARPGSEDYGPLSVLLALRGEVTVLREVGGKVFYPPAPVGSAVVRFRPGPLSPDLLAADRVARDAFLHRRKVLPAALKASGYDPGPVAAALARLGIDPSRRPETLSPADFSALGRLLRPAESGAV